VELPPAGAPVQQVSAANPAVPQPLSPVTPITPQPRIDAPLVRAPLPADAVTLPPPAPVQRAAPQPVAPVSAPAPAQVSAMATARPEGIGTSPGFDAAAQKAEADYKSLVGSFIRRNRFSPPQSRKAGISGSVKVRFIVDRRGGISAVAVAGSSGADLLDREAVQFVQALGRVPAFPNDLRKAEIPLSMTLKFDLERR
ncbi:MAG: TonB family protein, partial [Croceibacterium sp.]